MMILSFLSPIKGILKNRTARLLNVGNGQLKYIPKTGDSLRRESHMMRVRSVALQSTLLVF